MSTGFLQDSIFSLLHYSFIPDEYKGNFALAQKQLEKEKLNAEEQLFHAAQLYLLQGQTLKAIKHLDELHKKLSAHHPLQLRLLFYQWLTQSWRYNLFPDGNGAGALEIQSRWHSVKEIEQKQLQIDRLSKLIDPSPWQAEKLLIFRFLPGLQSTRSFIQSAARNASGLSARELLNVGLGQYQDFIQSAAYYQIPLTQQAYAHLAAADLCHRAGEEDLQLNYLTLAMNAYQEADDIIGLARCKVMHGDWLSAPFSSPLVMNYSVVDAYSEGSNQDWRIEEQEYSLEGAELEQATRLYEEAEQLFQQVGAERGLGHIHLRRFYLSWLEEDFEKAYQQAEKASIFFKNTGDQIGFYHSRTFMLLNDLALDRSQDALALAAEIGAWGKNSGSFSYTLGLGILINRVARHWLIRKVDFEKALLGYRIARLFFEHLDAPVNMAQASVDEGKAYELMSEFDQALIAYEYAADDFEMAMRRHPIIARDLHRFAVMLVQSHYKFRLEDDGWIFYFKICAKVKCSAVRQSISFCYFL